MDVIYNHSRWGLLVRSCLQVQPEKTYSNRHNDELARWKPYVEIVDSVPKQTVARHLAAVNQVVTPMVIDIFKDKIIFNPRRVREQVATHYSAETACFDEHDFSTPKEELLVEAIERITCLSTAFGLYQIFMSEDLENADQILVDTLNLEGPHFDRLSGSLDGFFEEFWPDRISRACCEYVEGRVEKSPNLTYQANKIHKTPKVWEVDQLSKVNII